jgi:putative FmdB family regulatory protein
MPFYEYQCSACAHQLEVLQKISDGPLKKCPDCGKQALKRLISAPVFRLKGAGWYETDFKSDKENKRNLAGSEEPAESKPEAAKTDAAKTDAASDTKKAEPKPEAPAKSESKKRVVAKPTSKAAAKPTKAKAPVRKPAVKKKARR